MEKIESLVTDVVEEGRRSEKSAFALAALIGLYIIFYLVPLNNRPLIIPDEVRYAEIPREMISTGDWVVPRLNGLRYFEKPPLGYWVNAASIRVFGENPFAVRLPGALAAGLTAWLIFQLCSAICIRRRVAIAAALIYLTIAEVFAVGTFSVLDNLLTLFLTAGMSSVYFGSRENHRWKRTGFFLISGVSFGLAFLTKGFLALAVPFIVLVPWLVWERRLDILFGKGALVLLTAIIVSLPWSLLINFREPDFWHYFFWVEHINRFAGDNAQHKSPFFFYLVFIPLLAFPWVSLFPAAVRGWRNGGGRIRNHSADRFLILWVIMPFMLYSLASGKLLTYILPCLPPLAILLAIGLLGGESRSVERSIGRGVFANAIILSALAVLLLSAQIFTTDYRAYRPDEWSSAVAVVAILVLVSGILFLASRNKLASNRVFANSLAILPLLFVLHYAVPAQVLEVQSTGGLFDQNRSLIASDALLVSEAPMIHSVAWYLKRSDAYMTSNGELRYGLGYPDTSNRYLEHVDFRQLVQKPSRSRTVALFCKGPCRPDLVDVLPVDAHQHVYGGSVLWIVP